MECAPYQAAVCPSGRPRFRARYISVQAAMARRRPVGLLLPVVLGVLIVATHPQWFLFALFGVYLLSGPTRPLWARRREGGLPADKAPRDAH